MEETLLAVYHYKMGKVMSLTVGFAFLVFFMYPAHFYVIE